MISFPRFNEGTGLTVSVASTTDVTELVTLINNAFKYQDEAKGEARTNQAGLLKKMSKSDFYVWKEIGGVIVACCYIEIHKDKLHFGLLAVEDRYRGKGLAPAIMDSIEHYAISLGKHLLELDYMDLSPWLKRYYERRGYNETGFVEDIGWSQLIRMVKAV